MCIERRLNSSTPSAETHSHLKSSLRCTEYCFMTGTLSVLPDTPSTLVALADCISYEPFAVLIENAAQMNCRRAPLPSPPLSSSLICLPSAPSHRAFFSSQPPQILSPASLKHRRGRCQALEPAPSESPLCIARTAECRLCEGHLASKEF